jgi:hypothetical protein
MKTYFCKEVKEDGTECGEENSEEFYEGRKSMCKSCEYRKWAKKQSDKEVEKKNIRKNEYSALTDKINFMVSEFNKVIGIFDNKEAKFTNLVNILNKNFEERVNNLKEENEERVNQLNKENEERVNQLIEENSVLRKDNSILRKDLAVITSMAPGVIPIEKLTNRILAIENYISIMGR